MRSIAMKMLGIILWCFGILALANSICAQSNVGLIRGAVKDSSGAVISGASVELTNPITKYLQTQISGSNGEFQLVDVPYNHYTLKISATGFNAQIQELTVNSNLAQEVNAQLGIGSIDQVINVTAGAELLETDKTAPSVIIDRAQILRSPDADLSRSTEKLIATAPGWTLDANGRLHARGIEYQVQYVVDGIPITDTIASTFAGAPDARNFRSVEISTANIPAEYGNKVAGVIAVNTRSGLEIPTSGDVTLSGGSFSTFESSFDIGGHTRKFGFFLSGAGTTTDRFLDPPAVENFHNDGDSIKGFFKLDYNATPRDLVRFNLGFDRSKFDVPNLPEDQANGQDQGRRLNDNTESLSLQHIFSPNTVGYFALFHRYNFAKLRSNDETGPVYSLQSRHYTNYGFLGSLTYHFKHNTVKAGVEFERFPLTESFTFAITDLDELLDRQPDLPDAVRDFTIASPFFFNEHRSGWEGSVYLQDHINLTQNLTFDIGARFDSYHFLVTKNFVSPRVGLAYYVNKTKTVLRASYNRFLETPALENLLLSSSDKALIFSPAGEDDPDMMDRGHHRHHVRAPGAADPADDEDMDMDAIKSEPVRPSRETQVDFGFQQQISHYLRLDTDFYYRRLKNPPEITSFLETGLVFPATLARSRSKGIEARLDLARVHGFSGFVSYTNLHIYGFAPITGGLFLGEAVDLLSRSGQRVNIEEDQRNTVVFQARYDKLPGKFWMAFGGRYDSGFSVELDADASAAEFAMEFPPKILNQINLDRGFIKPHTVLDLSIGRDVVLNEHLTMSGQFNIENIADSFHLITFESVFSGTTVGRPRSYNGRLSFSFK